MIRDVLTEQPAIALHRNISAEDDGVVLVGSRQATVRVSHVDVMSRGAHARGECGRNGVAVPVWFCDENERPGETAELLLLSDLSLHRDFILSALVGVENT